jgi:putative ABC transport system permease protein
MNKYMGATDALITRQGDEKAAVPQSLVEELNRDPDVKDAVGRLELDAVVQTSSGRKLPGRAAQVIGVRRPQDRQVESLNKVAGEWFNTSDGDVAVVDQVIARLLKGGRPTDEEAPMADVGDSLVLPLVDKQLRLKIVGIVRKPGVLAAHMPTVYVPIETLQKFAMPGQGGRVSRVMVQFKENVNSAAFAERWKPRLTRVDPALKLRLTRDNRKELDQNLQGLKVLSYLGGAVSMLAATFIVFSSLSMGVVERQRSLAMLRAIGAFRAQLGWLVVLEGFLLSVTGIAIGVPLGWLWVKLLSLRYHDLFAVGVVLSPGGVTFASLGALLTALAASFLPAWSAMRVSPLEAMNPLADPPRGSVPVWSALAGVACICIEPFMLMGPLDALVRAVGLGDNASAQQWVRAVKFYGHFAIGLPGILIGFFLLAPLLVWAVEAVAGRLAAALLGIRFQLLRQQLSSGIWRAAGTGAALMVGLAVLVAMQIQGRSSLEGWKLPDRFPDIFIVSPMPLIGGLSQEEIKKLEGVNGIKKGEVMAIAMATPQLGDNIFGILGASFLNDATMFFGVEPDLGFKMMDLEFRDDNGKPVSRDEQERLRKYAEEKLKLGRHVIITEEFRQLKHLKVGDKFPLKTASSGTVDYTIAGIVWSPGLDVVKSIFDMGQQIDERTAASVFGSIDDARRDFGVQSIRLFAANLEPGIDKNVLLRKVQAAVGKMGMQVGDVREIKAKIQAGFRRLLTLVSTVAFAAMAVAALGVTNTVMASIRSRRWQFGVLRSIGVTRSQLLRLVLAEAFLLGIVGCALGLLAGVEMAANAHVLQAAIIGYNPPLVVPWKMVAFGVAVVMFVAIAASLWPAASVARAEPLMLLQAGRAAA